MRPSTILPPEPEERLPSVRPPPLEDDDQAIWAEMDVRNASAGTGLPANDTTPTWRPAA